MKDNLKSKSSVKVKKALLVMSLIPYVIFLILGIVSFVQNTLEYKNFELHTLFEPIADFWVNILADGNIVLILLTMFCVGYPIFYVIDNHNKKTNESIINTNVKRKVDKLFILYIISFAPYLLLVYSCIFGIQFGLFFNYDTYYGFKALLLAVFFGSIIPVYPILLIFQTIYTIKKFKTFTPKRKNIIKFMIISLIALLIVPSIIHLILEKNNLNVTYNKDKIIIENYLKNEFGENHYNDMEIVEPDRISSRYKVTTPLLDYGFDIELDETRTEIVSTSFYEKFIEENDMHSKLGDYLTNLLGIPSNIKIISTIKSIGIDMKNYNKNDGVDILLNECDYYINTIYIYQNYYDKEEIISTIKDFYIKYDDNLKLNNSVSFVVKINERNYASIHAIKPTNKDDMLTLIFSGYNYGDGYTIEREEVDVDLSN